MYTTTAVACLSFWSVSHKTSSWDDGDVYSICEVLRANLEISTRVSIIYSTYT